MTSIRLLLLSVALLSLTACGATIYKLYEGEARSDSEVATIIKDGYHIRVDGEVIAPKTLGDKIIKVLPGKHKIDSVYTKGMSLDWHWYEMEATLEAGKIYTVNRRRFYYTSSTPVASRTFLEVVLDGDFPENTTFIWITDFATGAIVGGYKPELQPDGKYIADPSKGINI